MAMQHAVQCREYYNDNHVEIRERAEGGWAMTLVIRDAV
jgi:hypothetical protein